ncbi:hypothetical protein DFH11DRAFT_1726116 [Phellopilus nigrolimitatus]|nr:hypothetical protein DFH11DRAFT_1726116 [Phellopilus nigrolimitatus]
MRSAMKWAFFALTAHCLSVLAYTVPPGSPGFYHGNSSASVTFDAHSLFWMTSVYMCLAARFTPGAAPSGKPIWRDIFQKMKAGTPISVYHHWGVSEGKQGNLDFDYYRSQTDVYEVAKEVGLLVIARPGYPDGPVIAVQSENEFMESTPSDPGRSEYMQLIENTLRANGITKVPLTHNDKSPSGVFASGLGMVDLYNWDQYPNGFDCSNPSSWSGVSSNLNDLHQQIDPDVMWASAEFQGGSFDPWGGYGYDMCYDLLNEQFANVFYKNNYAAQVTLQSLYMTYGGTNWGNLAEPSVYTSYDYGAPIREDRTLTTKYSELKLQAYFLHASPDFLIAERFGNGTVGSGTAFSNNASIYTTALTSSTGVNFYVVRQTSNGITNSTDFTLQVNTTQGEVTIPQFGGQLTLDGRESKIIVSEYPFGSHTLIYSTAEVMTWTTLNATDFIILYALAGQSIEAVVSGGTGTPAISGCSSVNATTTNGTVVITGSPSGVCAISFGNATVLVADKVTATTFWAPRLPSSNATQYDQAPDVPAVLVAGPYLVRNATLSSDGSALLLTGDLNATTTLDVFAPESVTSVSWNGQGASLPSLKNVTWFCADSLPEIQDGFDDSNWIIANVTSTDRPYQPTGGKYILYADIYGFHQGNHIARGNFTGNATGVELSVQGGSNFGYSVFLNSAFLGSSQGTSSDMTNVTWTFNSTDVLSGENIVTVVFDQTGLEEDYGGDDSFKTPRGIRGYQLLGGGDFDVWKIQGNLGGEDYPDVVRGPLNEGGLFIERIGAHLPGFPTTNWSTSTNDSTCSPYVGLEAAGITAYRTTFDLDLPTNADVPVALQFERTPSSNYRSVIYINGWQFGRFSSNYGPQTVYPLPEGILNHQGSNELLFTIWSLDAAGAKIADVELVYTATIASGMEPIGLVDSPSYSDLRGHHNNTFYVSTTLVLDYEPEDSTARWDNIIFTTTDVFANNGNGWSDPVHFSFQGYDTSLQFVIDLETGKSLSGDPMTMWSGTGGIAPEGPHLYRRRDGYYLLIAEGTSSLYSMPSGTGLGHMVTMARAENISGPYTPCSYNPVLTNANTTEYLQTVGHADLLQDTSGNWWAVALATRNGTVNYPMGRETTLTPVVWDEGEFPVFNGGKPGHVHINMTGPLPPKKSPTVSPTSDPLLVYYRYPDFSRFTVSPDGHPNTLQILGSAENITGTEGVGTSTFIARRQDALEFSASVKMDFAPEVEGEEAGMTLFIQRNQHFDLGVVLLNNTYVNSSARLADGSALQKYIRLCTIDANATADGLEDAYSQSGLFPLPNNTGSLLLRVQAVNASTYSFSYTESSIARSVSAPYWTIVGYGAAREVSGGFTGTLVGMYATGNGRNSTAPAYFSDFVYEPVQGVY